jgi:hypothetical protein
VARFTKWLIFLVLILRFDDYEKKFYFAGLEGDFFSNEGGLMTDSLEIDPIRQLRL